MPRHWFIKSKRGVRGPVCSETLRTLAREGKLTPRHAVSRDGVKWYRAGKVRGLEFPLDSRQWYILTGRGKIGPVSLGRLARLAETARINSRTQISPNGDEWIRAKTHPKLRFYSVDLPRWLVQSSDWLAVDVHEGKQDADREDSRRHSLRELSKMALRGELLPTDLVSIDGQSWMKAKRIVGLNFAIRACRDDTVVSDSPKDVGPEEDRDEPAEAVPHDWMTVDQAAPAIWKLPIVAKPILYPMPPAPEPKPCPFETREYAFAQRFGDQWTLHRESNHHHGQTHVYEFSPSVSRGENRPMTTLVTSGLSDHRMTLPPGLNSPRVELVMYVDEARPEYVRLLHFLAQVPIQTGQPIGYGTTIGNGSPPRPIFQESLLDCYLFLVPPIESDFQIQEELRIQSDPVQLLWVMPITSSERRVVTEQGVQAFCALCDQHRDVGILVPGRHCYVTCNVPIQPLHPWKVV